jgi:hypothetical protein
VNSSTSTGGRDWAATPVERLARAARSRQAGVLAWSEIAATAAKLRMIERFMASTPC